MSLASISGITQTCFPNGAFFFGQEDLEFEMMANTSCRVIEGDLYLRGNVSDISMSSYRNLYRSLYNASNVLEL